MDALQTLTDTFSPAENEQINVLAGVALRSIAEDEDSTVDASDIHDVAQTLIDAGCDARTVMIFLLSLANPLDDLQGDYPQDMIDAARNVSLIRLLTPSDKPKHPAIRKVLLRQLVLKVTHDVRVMLVKIAGRLVMLRKAHDFSEGQRRRLAQEALDIIVPWCDALGLENWRQELQELSFQHLNPEGYNFVLSLMAGHRDTLTDVKEQVIAELRGLANRYNVPIDINGRIKTHYAIYRKMILDELRYDEILDRIGIRILTDNQFNCYYMQMAIEEELPYRHYRVRDYIANPRKPYNYQSLHINLVGPHEIVIELQIRTHEMHIKGEYGVAAHWKMYGGGDRADTGEDTKFAFLRTQTSKLLGNPMEILGNTLDELLFNNAIMPMDTDGYILDPSDGSRVESKSKQWITYRDVETNEQGYILDPGTGKLILDKAGDPIWYQSEILPDRVLVYTPDGDLKSLRRGATALDFAYYIHEDVGHTCLGAKVNGHLQRLDYPLQLGDRIQIIRRSNAKPSLDWMYNGYVTTKRAKEKVRRYFREKTDIPLPEVETVGREIVKKRLSAHHIKDLSFEDLTERLKFASQHEMLEAIGSGEISVAKLDDVLEEHILDQLQGETPTMSATLGELDLFYRPAQCCFPVPGDDTISYVSQSGGFTLHRADCRNIDGLDPERIATFIWPEEMVNCESTATTHLARLNLRVVQPSKTVVFIKEATNMLATPLEALRVSETPQGDTYMELTVRVRCKDHLVRLIHRLNVSDDVLMIRRVSA